MPLILIIIGLAGLVVWISFFLRKPKEEGKVVALAKNSREGLNIRWSDGEITIQKPADLEVMRRELMAAVGRRDLSIVERYTTYLNDKFHHEIDRKRIALYMDALGIIRDLYHTETEVIDAKDDREMMGLKKQIKELQLLSQKKSLELAIAKDESEIKILKVKSVKQPENRETKRHSKFQETITNLKDARNIRSLAEEWKSQPGVTQEEKDLIDRDVQQAISDLLRGK